MRDGNLRRSKHYMQISDDPKLSGDSAPEALIMSSIPPKSRLHNSQPFSEKEGGQHAIAGLNTDLREQKAQNGLYIWFQIHLADGVV